MKHRPCDRGIVALAIPFFEYQSNCVTQRKRIRVATVPPREKEWTVMPHGNSQYREARSPGDKENNERKAGVLGRILLVNFKIGDTLEHA